ncbi:hypothetical protein CIPAW_06G052300 [Carya illinoinensis]|uniref:Reverse transcriptase zinc-binding domain-containing protein n=1 Tax=Carya illinoinensis TaxID=32201 RepID=A0A8T1Q809_CARIL|nr:hypothetical protein CIPAW_06G052300 [Carya illinoinensis]
MSVFKMPAKLLKEIEAIIAKFWWCQSEAGNGIHWKSWGSMGIIKSQGGLGFRDFISFNRALLAKQLWRMIKVPQSLVSRVFKEKYFLNCDVMEAELKGSPSYIWRSIWSSMNLVKEGLVWRVGNGRDISIWKDKWLPRPVTYQVQTPPNILDPNCRVSDLINESSKSWKEDLVKTIFCKEETDLILSIPISRRGASDKKIWAGSTRGIFTVKSAYHMDTCLSKRRRGEPSSGGEDAGMWKDLWKLEAPGKIRMFVWGSLSNVLPTKDVLYRKNILKDNLCPICTREPESVIHALWSCPAARDVWGADSSKLKKWNSSFCDFQQLWKDMSTRLDSEELQMTAVKFQLLWKRRNAFVFKNQFMSPESISTLAQAEVSMLREANSMDSRGVEGGVSATVASRHWKAPEWPAVKVNFDASFDKLQKRGGIGIVVRDWEGKLKACLTSSRKNVFTAA